MWNKQEQKEEEMDSSHKHTIVFIGYSFKKKTWWKQENQRFKVILNDIGSLKLAWTVAA